VLNHYSLPSRTIEGISMLGRLHILFTNNSSYDKFSMAFALQVPILGDRSWEYKYHFVMLGDNCILLSLSLEIIIPKYILFK